SASLPARISLSAFARIHLDDLFIGTPPPLELALTAFMEPLPVNCYSATEPLTLTLKNNGSSLLDFSVTPAAVQVNVSGAATAAITHTVNSGALAPGATQNVTLPTALN